MTRQSKYVAGAIAAAAAVVCGLLFLAWQQQSDFRVLRLPHTMPMDHPVHRGIQRMADLVKERSKGKMVIQIYPSALLGGEAQIKELMQHGVMDIGKFSASAFEDNIPEMAAFSLPYLFRDEAHFWSVINSPLGEKILNAGYGTSAAVKGLCYYDAGARSFYSRKSAGPLNSPATLKGKKIRVMSTALMTRAVEYLGAAPTPIPFSELYSALQTGVIDAAENNIPSYYTNKHYEICPILSLSEHFRTPDILVMNQAVWDTLSADEQSIITRSALESAAYERELWSQETDSYLVNLKAMGMQVVPVDLEPLKKAAEPFYDALRLEAKTKPERQKMMDTVDAIRQMGEHK